MLRHKKTHVPNLAIESENGNNNRKRNNMLYDVLPNTAHLISTIKDEINNTKNSNNFVEDFGYAIDGTELFSTGKRRQILKPTKTRQKQKKTFNLDNSTTTHLPTTKCQIHKEKFIEPVIINNNDLVKNIANLFSKIQTVKNSVKTTEL